MTAEDLVGRRVYIIVKRTIGRTTTFTKKDGLVLSRGRGNQNKVDVLFDGNTGTSSVEIKRIKTS